MTLDLKRKAEIASVLCSMTEKIRLLIDFKMTSTSDIIKELKNDDALKELDFLQDYNFETKNEINVPLSNCDNKELNEYFRCIGTTDLQNQLVQNKAYMEFAKKREEFFTQEYEKRKKIYMAFGFFGGLVIALMLM